MVCGIPFFSMLHFNYWLIAEFECCIDCGEERNSMVRDIVDWVAVGQRLRRIRKASRLSQREFGQRCGVSQNMISLYEKGRSHASVEFYIQVAQFGNKTIEWLLVGCEDRTSETLHEMRDLHDRMSQSLSAVSGLLDRSSNEANDERIIGIDDSEVLREILLQNQIELPSCITDLLREERKWRDLQLTGREVYGFRILVRLFGDLNETALRALLAIVRDREAVQY
jgi:transcriptional regulator with XRE-family HTH domain